MWGGLAAYDLKSVLFMNNTIVNNTSEYDSYQMVIANAMYEEGQIP